MLDDERLNEVITKTAVLETRQNAHEDICAKRYGEIATAFSGVQAKLDSINGSIRGALVTLVLLLAGALGTVLWAKLNG
jgi:hypothetical protein